MSKIIQVALDKLMPHPKQFDLYEDTTPEDSFVALVENRGILQALLICDVKLFENEADTTGFDFGLVAGHRRLTAAQMLGMKTVPCMLKEYKSYEETEMDLVASNSQRKKTKKTIIKEIEYYKQISCQNPKLLDELLVRKYAFENGLEWGEALSRTKLPSRESEKLGQLVGVSKDEIKRTKFVLDGEKLDETIENNSILSEDYFDAIREIYEGIKNNYRAGEITLNSAYMEVKKLITEIENKGKALRNEIKEAKRKPKKEKKASKLIKLGELTCEESFPLEEFCLRKEYGLKSLVLYQNEVFLVDGDKNYRLNLLDLINKIGA